MKDTNPCIRCGKQRIPSRTWEENIQTYSGVSLVVHTEAICPDEKCQEIVDKELSVEREKREAIRESKRQKTEASMAKAGRKKSTTKK